MRNTAYYFRPFRQADFHHYERLVEAVQADGHTGDSQHPAGARERLCRPRFRPEQDLFLAETATTRAVVGFLELHPEPAIGRAVLECYIVPEHRRRGLGRRLLEKARARCIKLGIAASQVNISRGNTAAKGALEKLGFFPVRRHLELSFHLSRFLPDTAAPPGLTTQPLDPGQVRALACLQNRCFAGSWGYHPNEAAEINSLLRLRNSGPEDIIAACWEGRLAGFCWTNRDLLGRRGRIFMLGVDPDLRGKGIGRALLRAGLRHLRSQGAVEALLTVDSRNRKALALYRSAGLRPCGCSVWYAMPNFTDKTLLSPQCEGTIRL